MVVVLYLIIGFLFGYIKAILMPIFCSGRKAKENIQIKICEGDRFYS